MVMHKPSVLRGTVVFGTVRVVQCLLMDLGPAHRMNTDELRRAACLVSHPKPSSRTI
jgi:hypothetical protein